MATNQVKVEEVNVEIKAEPEIQTPVRAILSDAIQQLVKNRERRLLTKKRSSNSSSSCSSTDDASPPKMPKLDFHGDDENVHDSTSDESQPLSPFLDPPSLLNALQLLNQHLSTAQQAKTVDGNTQFATVCGRLSLLSARRYPVTVAEISRRIKGPENFNFSLVGGLLRRAKTPQGTAILKQELENVGIEVEKGRRRAPFSSLFESLVETEAIELGKDFNTIVTSAFPVTPIAKYLVNEKTPSVASQKIEKLKAAREVLTEFCTVLLMDSSPIVNEEPPQMLPDDIQESLSNFSAMTHGFGGTAVKSVMEMYLKFIDAQITSLHQI